MADNTLPPDWAVLLIGGHSGTGKTVVARTLARQWGIALAEVDDFRLVLQRVTTPAQQPALHAMLADLADAGTPAEALCRDLVAVAEIMSTALEIVIANHVATRMPLILEGDGLLPALAARRVVAGLDVGGQVRAVFLVDPDEQRLFANALARGRGFQHLSADDQQRQVRLSWLYGQWLAQEAARYGQPVLAPQPWNTLAARIVAAVV